MTKQKYKLIEKMEFSGNMNQRREDLLRNIAGDNIVDEFERVLEEVIKVRSGKR
jgi:hypothetical protein